MARAQSSGLGMGDRVRAASGAEDAEDDRHAVGAGGIVRVPVSQDDGGVRNGAQGQGRLDPRHHVGAAAALKPLPQRQQLRASEHGDRLVGDGVAGDDHDRPPQPLQHAADFRERAGEILVGHRPGGVDHAGHGGEHLALERRAQERGVRLGASMRTLPTVVELLAASHGDRPAQAASQALPPVDLGRLDLFGPAEPGRRARAGRGDRPRAPGPPAAPRTALRGEPWSARRGTRSPRGPRRIPRSTRAAGSACGRPREPAVRRSRSDRGSRR